MISSSDLRRHAKIEIAALGILATSLVLTAVGQESQQDRYNHAVTLYNSNSPSDAEKACDIMQQLVQEAPANQTYQNTRRTFCNDVQSILDTERKAAEKGVQLARGGNCKDAKAYYEQIANLRMKDSTYRDQLKKELDVCESGSKQDQVARQQLDHASQLFQNGKDFEARAILQPIASSGGRLAEEAKQLLTRIDQAEEKDHALVTKARELVSQGNNSEARVLLQKVVHRGGPDSSDARKVLFQSGGKVSDEELRAGLKAYFSGDLATAENDFTNYLNSAGDRSALAYFFRGATRSSRFYLSGETDNPLKNSAAADFQVVRLQYKAFRPPLQFISPKIRALYNAQ